jgi:hypothetical protein
MTVSLAELLRLARTPNPATRIAKLPSGRGLALAGVNLTCCRNWELWASQR